MVRTISRLPPDPALHPQAGEAMPERLVLAP
jgi:hypothetical protein